MVCVWSLPAHPQATWCHEADYYYYTLFTYMKKLRIKERLSNLSKVKIAVLVVNTNRFFFSIGKMVSILAETCNLFCLPRIFPTCELPHPHSTLHWVGLSTPWPIPCLPLFRDLPKKWVDTSNVIGACSFLWHNLLWRMIRASSHQESDLHI